MRDHIEYYANFEKKNKFKAELFRDGQLISSGNTVPAIRNMQVIAAKSGIFALEFVIFIKDIPNRENPSNIKQVIKLDEDGNMLESLREDSNVFRVWNIDTSLVYELLEAQIVNMKRRAK